ncbi:hypothetical protein LACPH_001773 [Lacticaseibacillus parahuelsenbergensis]|uniref:Uncharacterized protein n=1 Tax=Lacticaseibacillus parahuelsenbergensis TaxID=3068305 RepID=A0ABY9L046_9LACO|nr:hypothetical protein [Lacticaseibacillus sp. NCIMB 15471]WLV77054.1 hypothetical protein LACPH_001773 [Lacticaseibacillus sp. NCIMB 15471]
MGNKYDFKKATPLTFSDVIYQEFFMFGDDENQLHIYDADL